MAGNPWAGATTSQWYIQEVTPGETPVTPIWSAFRYTGGIPTLTKEALQSEELDDSREITDIRTGNESTAGEFSVELSPGSYTSVLENALRTSAETGFTETAVEITVDAVAKTFTRTAGDFVADGVVAGDLIYFKDLTGRNADAFVVTAVAALVISGGAITTTLTTETATTDYTVADKYKTGSECKTMSVLTWLRGRCGTIEKYLLTTGVEMTGFSFEVAVNANVTGSFPMIDRKQVIIDAPPSGSSFLPAPTGRVFSGVDGKVIVDDAVAAYVTSATMTNDNSASPQFTLGDKSVSFVEIGRALNTVSASAFMENFDLHDLFLNDTESALNIVLSGPSGAMSFSYPKVFFTASTPEIGGETSITQTIEATATGNKQQSSIVIQEIVY